MAYTALARKWRPRRFSEMIGQEHVLRSLSNALASGRVHHAFLFAGTRGVGKTTVARILAKCLNCERGVSAEPCLSCGSCREIEAGRSIDLIEVDAASRTKVDDTRELLDNVQYAPSRSRFKIYLIDEVHMLTTSSFNALLKTLEEPPPHVKFLLATTDPQKLPVTVLSRCLQFNLKRLPVALISARLAHILTEEQLAYEAPALQLLAQAADGSMRDALSLLDQLLAFGDGAAREAEARAMLGAVTRDHVERIAALLASADAPALLGAAEALDEFAPDYGQILDQLAALLERIALQQLLPEYAADELFAPAVVRDLAARISREDVQLYYQTAIIGRRDLALAPEPRTGFRMTLIRMLAFRPEGPAQAVAGAAAALASAPGTQRPVAAPVPASATAAAMPAADASSAVEWSSLVAALELDGPTRMLALNCALLARSPGLIRLTLDPHNAAAHTRAREQRLAQALSRVLGEAVRVEFVSGGSLAPTPAQAEDRAAQEALAAARAALAADPTVQALQQRFGATVNSESVRPRKPA
ncbi:MAG TPA: DNA polymerase III subunit gamma/tau [Steroidobacteraceae bacterium]|nr:DNA polymerase III subunit gamma/tau [Steroidobacteraceae bacterium]